MAKIDANFNKIIFDLIMPRAAKFSAGLLNKGQSPNFNLSTDSEPGPVQSDLKSVMAFFDATDSADTFYRAMRGEIGYNQLSIKMGAKLQSDILSILERDHKASGMSRIRAVTGEASRQARHGSPDGPWNRSVLHAPEVYLGRSDGQ